MNNEEISNMEQAVEKEEILSHLSVGGLGFPGYGYSNLSTKQR